MPSPESIARPRPAPRRRSPQLRAVPPALRVVPPPRLRVAEVALFHGERGGAMRTYIDSRASWARATGAIEHHVIVPAAGAPTGRELSALRLAESNGYLVPRGGGALQATLHALRPDVVLLHGPFWGPRTVAQTAHRIGATVVAVHHGSTAIDAAALPGPDGMWGPALRAWMRHAYRDVDGVIAAVDPPADCARPAAIALRFGLDPAFVPQPRVPREDHVLYVGRLGSDKGVAELLHAAAGSSEPWPLRIVGRGPMEQRLRCLAERLGLADRVQWRPYVRERAELATAYAAARVVVVPGAHETFGLVGLEAAACGAPVVACSTVPSARHMRLLVETFAPGDVHGLLRAIESARRREPDPVAAGALAARSTWAAAFEVETAQLARLAGERFPAGPPR